MPCSVVLVLTFTYIVTQFAHIWRSCEDNNHLNVCHDLTFCICVLFCPLAGHLGY